MIFKIHLNPHLIAQQGLNSDDIAKIEALYKVKYDLIQRMKRSKKPETLRRLAGEVTEVEYHLQEAWHFSKNADFHKFWELPHCSCNPSDNRLLWPSRHYWRDDSCIIHGVEKIK